MVDRRTLLSGVIAGGAMLGLAGCGSGASDVHEGTEAEDVSCVRFRVGVPASIDPAFIEDEAGRIIASQLFDTLMRLDPISGSIVPCAASGCVLSEDARTITFTLHAGRTFHNGEPVNALAFKRAWERLVRPVDSEGSAADGDASPADPAHHAPSAQLLRLVNGFDALYTGAASELAGLHCPDDATLVVELAAPCAEWPYLAARPELAPVPAAVAEDPDAFALQPIGNGPFRMRDPWKSKMEIHIAAWEGYAPGRPTVDGALFSLEPSTSAAYKQFRTGDLDVCDVPVDQYDEAAESAGVSADGRTFGPGSRMVRSTMPGLLYLSCNTARAPFNMPAVRRAIALAVDAEALCDKTLRSSYEQALTPVPPCVSQGGLPAWPSGTYDPDGAAELLEEAYPLDAAGSRGLSMSLVHRKGGVHARVAERVADDLRAVGIEVKVEALEPDDLAVAYEEGDYEIGLAAWAPAALAIGSFADPLLHGEVRTEPLPQTAPAAFENISGYARAEVDEFLDRAGGTLDDVVRRDLYVQALALAGEDSPIIPLAHPVRTSVASDRVTHMVIGADGVPELAHAVL